MLKFKTRVARLNDPSHFHNCRAEDKFEEFIEPRKLLEEKGFIFPKQPTGVINNIYNTVA